MAGWVPGTVPRGLTRRRATENADTEDPCVASTGQGLLWTWRGLMDSSGVEGLGRSEPLGLGNPIVDFLDRWHLLRKLAYLVGQF